MGLTRPNGNKSCKATHLMLYFLYMVSCINDIPIYYFVSSVQKWTLTKFCMCLAWCQNIIWHLKFERNVPQTHMWDWTLIYIWYTRKTVATFEKVILKLREKWYTWHENQLAVYEMCLALRDISKQIFCILNSEQVKIRVKIRQN